MLFNSYAFLLLFLPATLAVFYLLLLRRGPEAAIAALGISSIAFYAWWGLQDLPLLLISILVNFALARRMALREGSVRKRLFIFGIVFNLLLLGYFKYAGFISANLHSISASIPPLSVALPLAISFFTFQQISFLRGVYSHADYVPQFTRYATFISFFPHLIAGPILHHKDIQPQFGELKREVPWGSITLGIALFSIGLFKKVMIADPMGMLADPLYALENLSFFEAWSAAFLYGFQLYFDFSGYSDMAIGLAHLFGIRFPKNFNSPYRALSIADFWRRWHITLSTFLREFLYIPLGGNRRGFVRMLANLLVTMILGGLWHGASWNFVLWGLVHGVLLVIHALWQRTGFSLPRPIAWALTLLAVMAAWVLFRAPDIATATSIYAAMLSVPTLAAFSAEHIAWICGALAVCLLLPNSVSWVRESALPFGQSCFAFALNFRCWLLISALFLIAFAYLSRLSIFLYFNF